MASRWVSLETVLFIINHYTIYPNPPFSRNAVFFPSQHANKVQLSVPFAISKNLKFLFFPSTINAWNALDFDCTTINSLNSFKCAVLNHNHSQIIQLLPCLLLLLFFLSSSLFLACFAGSGIGPRLILAISFAIFLLTRVFI